MGEGMSPENSFAAYSPASPTTTTDTSRGLLVRLRRDGKLVVASDVVGLRYGAGNDALEALTEWWSQVSDILGVENAGGPLLREINAYKEALS